MRKKFTMLLASLFMTMGTAWAQTALVDGVYTIKNLINSRGTLVAVENQENVGATDITLGGYENLSETAMTDGDKWYVRTVGGNTFLYNIANGKFVNTRNANEAKFVNDPVVGISLTSVAGDRYRIVNGSYTIGVSLGWGKGNSIRWLTGSEDASMNLDFKVVENGAESYATAIATANGKIDAFDPTKLYRVYNKKKNDNDTYADTENMAWSPEGNHLAAYNAEAENQLWRFIQGTGDNAEKYLIYNVATGKYMREVVGSNGVQLTANENEAVYYTMKKHASENKYAFCSSNDQKNHLYNDGGGKLAGWTGKDNEYFTLEAVEKKVNVTYSFKFDGVEKYTQTESLNAGDKYPDFKVTLPSGVSAEAKPAGRVGLTDVNKDVALTVWLPFQYAASYDEVQHWYYMTIRDSEPTYMYYDPALECIRATENAVNAGNKDAYTWGFVGNPFDGIRIVNRAAGASKVLSSPKAPTGNQNADELVRMVEVTNEYSGNLVWDFVKANHTGKNPLPVAGTFYVQHPTAKSYALNRQDINQIKTVCYWNQRDTGSALHVIECDGVHNLSDLSNNTVYTLQAQRSPLMYSTTEGKTSKLSSGLVDRVAAVNNDVNQQFLILRTNNTPADKYYLYSVGAKKFVNKNLEFVDFPTPVLSFEAYTGSNSVVFPWRVKIDGKYVIPGNDGTAGNKIFHTDGGDDDEGKRYRIGIAAAEAYDATTLLAKIESAESLVQSVADFSNDKVYTVTPADNANTGVWDVKSDGSMLAITAFTGNEVNPESTNQQFAFLAVNGEHFLYSYGAGKFVAKNGNGQKLTDELSDACHVEFLASTISSNQAWYPLVVKVGGSQLHSSYQSHLSGNGGIISNWDHTESAGNAVAIMAVEGTVDLSAAIAKVDAYQAAKLKVELATLITNATTLVGKDYIGTAGKEALNSAIAAGQSVYDNAAADFAAVSAQVTALTNTINEVGYVVDPAEFSNNAVYTFLAQVSENAYLMWDGEQDVVASPYMLTELVGGDNVDNSKWAVYKSAKNKYYMYNLGAAKFMGIQTEGDTSIPFSATPQTSTLTFKKSDVATHPIMISSNGGDGSVNHSNQSFEGKNLAGVLNWAGGFGEASNSGNVHKVAIVGELDEAVLTIIAAAVATFEEREDALMELEIAVADASRLIEQSDDAPGYKSSTMENLTEKMESIFNFDENNATIEEINEKTAEANEIIASFKLNVPQAGKFYRFKHPSEDAYMLSHTTTVNSNKRLAMGALNGNEVASIFYHDGNTLLSYAIGQHVSSAPKNSTTDWTCLAVGAEAPVVTYGAGTVLGTLGFYLGSDATRAYFSGRKTYVDAGGSIAGGEGYDWSIVEVTELPVAVSAAGYATLYAPVALTIPTEGVTVYTATVDGTTLNLKALTGTIPAETGVIIEAAQGTYNFAVAADVDRISGNALTGKYAKSVKNDEMKVYTLQMPNKEDKNSVGFYLFKGENAQGETTYINGFRAWVELPAGSNVQALRFTRGDEEDTTGIESVEANEELVIFDLAGRRVEKMEKGIYIVNGKKVVIK